MIVELNREDLICLVKGMPPYFTAYENPLVIKAEHEYCEQYSRTNWNGLSKLTEEELYSLYCICKNSWK